MLEKTAWDQISPTVQRSTAALFQGDLASSAADRDQAAGTSSHAHLRVGRIEHVAVELYNDDEYGREGTPTWFKPPCGCLSTGPEGEIAILSCFDSTASTVVSPTSPSALNAYYIIQV